MTDEQRQEIMRRQAEGMRAMSWQEIARRQGELAHGLQQRGEMTNGKQQAMQNFWGGTSEPKRPRPTLWQRFQAWRERTGFFKDGSDGGM